MSPNSGGCQGFENAGSEPPTGVTTALHAKPEGTTGDVIDGSTGDRHSSSGFYGGADEEYRSAYLARVRGEIDTPAWWNYITTRGKRWS